MRAGAAPLHDRLAEGPPGGRAVWLRAADGVRIRAALWPAPGARGVVVLLPGRTEYIEKYGRAARELVARGWSVLTLDWRGQGLADRALADPMLGHVADFAEYQRDLDAALGWLEVEAPGTARLMPAHSMGGAIGLRALHRGLGFRAAAFSAPMWGIRMPLWRLPAAQVLSRIPLKLRRDLDYAPTTSGISYLRLAGFDGNHLTGDPAMWDYMRRHAAEVEAFGLGGPSLAWVRAAMRETRALMAAPAPGVPALVALGTRERIVLPRPVHRRLADWRQAQLEIFPDARHEVLMERPEARGRFLDHADGLFGAALERG
ncbi:alpha/beta fold hydrolase [Pseudogemmobacter sonorensis]|uniref:alpha/beta fold hydrolase n=1 Tax=Pseudogemmobacter sonorensis TaxID=2989681 RepID=UPI0036CCE4DF